MSPRATCYHNRECRSFKVTLFVPFQVLPEVIPLTQSWYTTTIAAGLETIAGLVYIVYISISAFVTKDSGQLRAVIFSPSACPSPQLFKYYRTRLYYWLYFSLRYLFSLRFLFDSFCAGCSIGVVALYQYRLISQHLPVLQSIVHEAPSPTISIIPFSLHHSF